MPRLDAQPLRGRRAIVTGAARGIGRAIALLFGEAGAGLVLSDLDHEGLRQTATDLHPGRRVVVIAADLCDEAAVSAAVREARQARRHRSAGQQRSYPGSRRHSR